MAALIRQRVQDRIRVAIEGEFGPMPPLQTEQVELEALDDDGRTVTVPVEVAARPLRPLNVPSYASRAYSVLQSGNLALTLYDTLPQSVRPEADQGYRRIYTGEEAQALAAEARLVVSLKGGEWREPQGARPVANAVAVRGLDLARGLGPNGNTTYDDTMYLIVDAAGAQTEVYECRMTTESSNTDPGVGRLNSMQVIYVRGLHRGTDPAYRLKGNAAEGTRSGQQGAHQITGANLHSAYTTRTIDSTTPLSPNVSLGCQVVAASKRDFEKNVVALLDAKGIREFPYTIVEGDELAMLNRTLNERGKHSLLVEGIPRPMGQEG